jgi:predicted CopG family antitoxin
MQIMNFSKEEVRKKLEKVFEKRQANVLAEVITDAYTELVKAKDFNELKQVVKELAEAQKRTELRVEELAAAQERTEISLNRLIGRVDLVEDRLEGISNSVGYSLEDKSYKSLPDLLKKEDIVMEGNMIRRYYRIGNKDQQINIFAKGRRNGKEILILGEVKVRPSKKEIDRFLKIAEQVRREEGNPETYLLFVANDYHPNTEQYLEEKGIRYFWSYEF